MSDRKEWIHEFFGGPQDFYGTVYKTMGVFGKKDPEKEVDLGERPPKPGL